MGRRQSPHRPSHSAPDWTHRQHALALLYGTWACALRCYLAFRAQHKAALWYLASHFVNSHIPRLCSLCSTGSDLLTQKLVLSDVILDATHTLMSWCEYSLYILYKGKSLYAIFNFFQDLKLSFWMPLCHHALFVPSGFCVILSCMPCTKSSANNNDLDKISVVNRKPWLICSLETATFPPLSVCKEADTDKTEPKQSRS